MGIKPRILTIDRNQRNLELLNQFLGKEGYETLPMTTLSDLAKILEHPEKLGLALVDISGFDRSIWEYCEQLSNKGIPLLVVAPQQLANIRQEGLSHGADGVLFKPLVVKELMSLIRSLIREDSNE